jgi:hypothetical protein
MFKDIIRSILIKLSVFLFRNNDSKIIFYHDIHDKNIFCKTSTPLNLFKQHVKQVRSSGYQIVSNFTESNYQVKIQFDDGFKGIHDCLEYIIDQKVFVEIFVIASKLNSEGYLSSQELLNLKKSGFVKVSSHTYSHFKLTDCDDLQLDFELKQSKIFLQDLIDEKIDSICYPEGLFSEKIINFCSLNNYKYQYCSIPGSYINNSYQNVYNRNLVQFIDSKELNDVLNGGYQIFKSWFWKKHFTR